MSIGLKIKALRDEKKWSQEVLGDKIGVTKAQISKYENGENVPPLEKLELIAGIFNIKVEEMFSDTGIVKVNSTQQGVPLEKFLEVADELRSLNKDLNQRLKNEIAYEREIKELRLKIQELEFKLKQG